MIEVKNLSKFYDKQTVLDDISLQVESGKIIGLLGSSGSGKTTLMGIIGGIIPFNKGEVHIEQYPPGKESKAIVSMLTERNALPKRMKVKDAVHFFKTMYQDFNEKKFHDIIKSTHMQLHMDKRVNQLSKGMQQLLRLALTLGRDAKYYLLDEPLGGVDVFIKEQVMNILFGYVDDEATILLSTHLIPDIEMLIEQVIFMDKGAIVGVHACEDLRAEKGQSIKQAFKEAIRWGD